MAALSELFDPRRERRGIPRHYRSSASPPREWQCDDVQLIEISSSGFRASATGNVWPGEKIRIGIPGLGTKLAEVKWVRDSSFGAEFSSPADLRLLFLGGPIQGRSTWLERAAAP